MTGIMRNWLGVSVLALALAVSGSQRAGAQAAPDSAAAPAAAAKPAAKSAPKRSQAGTGHVYLMRGLLNIFSLGMDDLAAKIQAKGISASVHNHSEWQGISDDIAAKYKAGKHGPIILVGHSLGADAVMFMGEYLGKKGVPVALVVPLDGTGSFAASSNVARVMNLTQRDYAHMRRGSGFRGELSNIDVSNQAGIDHINIDKSARLHNMVLGRIQSVLGRGGGGGASPSRVVGDGTSAPQTRPAAAGPAAPAAEPAAAPRPAAPAESAPPAAAPKPQAGVATTSGISNERAARPDSPAAPKPASAPAGSGAAPAKPALRF
jgi:hypothetical protein